MAHMYECCTLEMLSGLQPAYTGLTVKSAMMSVADLFAGQYLYPGVKRTRIGTLGSVSMVVFSGPVVTRRWQE